MNCDRKRCSRSTCQQQTRVSNKRRIFDKPGSELGGVAGGANAQPIDECCSTQCRRSRRHHKRHQQQRTTSSS